MATVTKTFTEAGSDASTWTINLICNNVNITGATFDLYDVVSCTGKFVNSKKSLGQIWIRARYSIGSYSTRPYQYFNKSNSNIPYNGLDYMTSGAVYTTTKGSSYRMTGIQTSNIFNATNSTSRTADIVVSSDHIFLRSADKYFNYDNNYSSDTDTSWGKVATVTLDVPPTATVSALTTDTLYVYAGLTTASVTVSDATAYYGGNIDSVTLTIGSQIASISGNGTLSILLNASGTFTPVVIITDSRGQVQEYQLDPITVGTYSTPTVNFDAQRTTNTGALDDEGAYATIVTTLTFDPVAEAVAPSVSVTDEDGNAQTVSTTWYSSRASDGTLSGAVTWSTLPSGSTVYGLVSITGDFDTQKSYVISLTPQDSEGITGDVKTDTLQTAFYTVDFLAGGHGIAFGQPATQDGFFCNMQASFVDANDVMRALFDFIHPVGSYYETSDTTFDPNVTWGGTWVKDSAGRVTVAQDADDADFDTIGELGGAKTHTLIADQLPKIEGSFDIRPWRSGTTNGATQVNATGVFGRETGSSQTGVQTSGASASSYKTTMSFGNNQPHNNLQPYVIVNRWHRTA